MCDEICEAGPLHQIECQLFADAFSNQTSDKNGCDEVWLKPPEIKCGPNPVPFYSSIGPLRLLLKARQGMTREIARNNDDNTPRDVSNSFTKHIFVLKVLESPCIVGISLYFGTAQ